MRYVFARLYGFTLGRTFRQLPEQACQDAASMLVIGVGIPRCCVLFVVVGVFKPQLFTSKDWIPWVTIPAAVVMYFSTRALQQYARRPEIADAFRTPSSRLITMLGYITVLALAPLLAGVLMRVLRR